MATINLFVRLTLVSFYMYTYNAKATEGTNSLPKFPAIFIVGDSVMDTGNNDYIPTWVKANYPPYGQNYRDQLATGRFSNGKLIPDLLASTLGIKEAIPPFLDPNLSNDDLITGVNFASAGSGFDDLTSVFSGAIPVSKQIDNFRNYIVRLQGIVGQQNATNIINSALVVLSAGTNDWFFNFYDIPVRRVQYDVNGYQDFLLARVKDFIQELYELGCRSIMVSGLAPTGCLPAQMILQLREPSQRQCVEDQNKDSQVYNKKLVNLLSGLQVNPTLPGIKLVYNDFYTPFIDMVNNPQNYGFVETKEGCCARGIAELAFFCIPLVPACENPDQFLFWDTIHPTSAAYRHIFKSIATNVLPQFL